MDKSTLFKYLLVLSIASLGALALNTGTSAQTSLVPDSTLDQESSQVEQVDAVTEHIRGGAIRGTNLFHSFLEFNVAEGHQVYFMPSLGIENILSRVTGSNPSSILGTLGVEGAANLFLLNPQGIAFGPNARLDIEGSFAASTAGALTFADGSTFNAVNPEAASLLSVNVPLGLQYGPNAPDSSIENTGILAVGQDLTLTADHLNLQGQLRAGRALTLQATDTLQIRDTPERPFVATAGGQLTVQGNAEVDIFALAHPDSGLLSGSDLVLRSANPVGGDAHYWSGGDFRIEALDGSVGDLYSPYDPIIRTLGDVTIREYQGTSLHILAGGSVEIETAIITDPEQGTLGTNFLQEAITLSDGTVVEIDGATQPTLDVRAGVKTTAISSPLPEVLTGVDTGSDFIFGSDITDEPSSANITVGDILLNAPDGLVLLTNQYEPNESLLSGSIAVTGEGTQGFGIDARGFSEQGGKVYIDSRDNIFVLNSVIDTSGIGEVGDITLVADQLVRFDGSDHSRRVGALTVLRPREEGSAGNVKITASTLEVLNSARLVSGTLSNGDAGNVILLIEETARFEGFNPVTGIPSGASAISAGNGNGGNVEITATNLDVLNGAQFSTNSFSSGNAGNVILLIEETARFEGFNPVLGDPSGASATSTGDGNGGNVEITATNLDVLNGAQFRTNSFPFSSGNAGNVILLIEETARFEGFNPVTGPSGVFSFVEGDAEKNGGNIEIRAANLEVLNGAVFFSSTLGIGNAGNVILTIDETAHFDSDSGVFSIAAPGGNDSNSGNGGNIEITATNLALLNESIIAASTLGTGKAGNVILTIDDHLQLTNGRIATNGLFNSGGEVTITAQSINLLGDSDIITLVGSGKENGGSITLTADSILVFDDSDIFTFSADGRGGDITFNSPAFFGENYQPSPEGIDPFTLNDNNRVDINASGSFSGIVTLPDVSFIQDNLADLPENLVNTEQLIAGSCIARNQQGGSFIISGSGGLSDRPDGEFIAPYPLGNVRSFSDENAATKTNDSARWQSGDDIIEPQGLFQMPNGQLILSRKCAAE